HRYRRRGGRRPSARRLGRGDGEPDAAGALALPHRLLLDATPLLGACAPHPARLRGGARADAPGGEGRGSDRALDRHVLLCAPRHLAPALSLEHAGCLLPRLGACSRARFRAPRARPATPYPSRQRAPALLLLARLPRTPLRGHGPRPDPLLMDPGLSRKNLRLRLLLFVAVGGLFLGAG